MPALAALVWGVITTILSSLISRIVTALGLGMVSYSGASTLLAFLKSSITSSVHSAPAAVVSILGMFGFGQAISILFGAVTIRMTLAGMDSAGNFVQARWKGFGK
ncbi:DUF2523 domain-containing protein [Aquitalea sp. ASV11]|uniref:DUF2523 domain-containing protein n=1 Tax=Aquitalea sp. ASV11 TaxID=2795103 RepID=UPI0018EA5392|nr:DUF2523 domain-containing protein [Aquitalea sp. ASV11]